MANKRIDEITAKTTIVDADLFPIYDSEEGGAEKTKKITFANAIGYSQGSFTPEIADASSGGNVGSAASAGGVYTKINRMVRVHITLTNIDTTGLTAGNSLFIRDLPFTPGIYSHVGVVWIQSTTVSGLWVIAMIESGCVVLKEIVSASSSSTLIVSDFTSPVADVKIDMTYFT